MKTIILIIFIISLYFFIKDLMELYENYKLQKEWIIEKEKYFNKGGIENGKYSNINDKSNFR